MLNLHLKSAPEQESLESYLAFAYFAPTRIKHIESAWFAVTRQIMVDC